MHVDARGALWPLRRVVQMVPHQRDLPRDQPARQIR